MTTPGETPPDTTTEPRMPWLKWRTVQPLRHRDYRLLITATTFALFGTGMWTVVMVYQVFEIVGPNPAALSLVAGAMSVGVLVFALVGGIIADRVSKRLILVVIQAVDTLSVSAVAVLSFTGAIELWHVAVAAFALGVSQSFYYPAYSAFLPRILPPDQLLAANGLEGAIRPTFAQALGPAIGGIVVGALFPAAGAAVVAAAYGVALVLLVFVRPEPPLVHPEGEEPPPSPGFWHDLADGVRFTVRTPWLLWTLLFAALLLLVIMGPIEVLLPFITDQRFENSEQAYGFLLASFGIGGAIGSLAVSSWRLPRRYLTVMMLAWGFGCLPLAIIGYLDWFWVMLGALAITGFTFSAGSVIWGTLLQRRVPLTMLGRVSSLDFFVSISLMPVSIALVGPIAAVVPIPIIFLVAGLLPPLLAIGGILAGRMWTDEIANPLDTEPEG